MPYSLILDLFVALLLIITIGFAVVLNKRLGKLRGDREAFEKLAETFGESISRAEDGISTLHQTTDVLQQRLEKAQALKDDLAFLIERGDRTADNLEDLVRANRDTVGGTSGIQPDPNLGHLVYDLDLPEGLEKASDLVSKLRVELRDSPHLVRVQDRDQQAKPR